MSQPKKVVRSFSTSQEGLPLDSFADTPLLVTAYKSAVTGTGKAIILVTAYPNYKVENDEVKEYGEPVTVRIIGKIPVGTFMKVVAPYLDRGTAVEIVPACIKSKNGKHYENILSPSEYSIKKASGQIANIEECRKVIEEYIQSRKQESQPRQEEEVMKMPTIDQGVKIKIINFIKEKGGKITMKDWKEFKEKDPALSTLMTEALKEMREEGRVDVKNGVITLRDSGPDDIETEFG